MRTLGGNIVLLSITPFEQNESVQLPEKTSLIAPSEIRLLRLSYGLSVEQFALLLDWKPAKLDAYEHGACIEERDARLLLRLQNPDDMLKYLLKLTSAA